MAAVELASMVTALEKESGGFSEKQIVDRAERNFPQPFVVGDESGDDVGDAGGEAEGESGDETLQVHWTAQGVDNTEGREKETYLRYADSVEARPSFSTARGPISSGRRLQEARGSTGRSAAARTWWRSWQQRSPGLSSLHWEIMSFCQWLQLSEDENRQRLEAVAEINDVVRCIWPQAILHIFGSSATGLALPGSDVDLAIESRKGIPNTILDSGSSKRQKAAAWEWLRPLMNRLKQRQLVQDLEPIAFARVPILKVVMRESGLKIDVAFDVLNGPRAVPFVLQQLQEYSALRPLCLLLKCFLGQRSLNEAFRGGIGSYCLLNMVVSYLQDLMGEAGTDDLGKLLLGFFMCYGKLHNYLYDVVATRGGRPRSKQERGWENIDNPELLSVEDPQAPENDIGRVSYRIDEVRSEFLAAAQSLQQCWGEEKVLLSVLDLDRTRYQFGADLRPTSEERRGKKRKGGPDEVQVRSPNLPQEGRKKKKAKIKNKLFTTPIQTEEVHAEFNKQLIEEHHQMVARRPRDQILHREPPASAHQSVETRMRFRPPPFPAQEMGIPTAAAHVGNERSAYGDGLLMPSVDRMMFGARGGIVAQGLHRPHFEGDRRMPYTQLPAIHPVSVSGLLLAQPAIHGWEPHRPPVVIQDRLALAIPSNIGTPTLNDVDADFRSYFSEALHGGSVDDSPTMGCHGSEGRRTRSAVIGDPSKPHSGRKRKQKPESRRYWRKQSQKARAKRRGAEMMGYSGVASVHVGKEIVAHALHG